MVRGICLVVMVFLMASCGNEEYNAPVVTVTMPQVGDSFSVGDTILVNFSVSSTGPVDVVSVKMLGPDAQPASSQLNFYPVNATYSGSAQLVLADKNFSGGDCQLKVSANHGDATTSVFVAVHINPIARVLRGVYVLVADGGGSVLWKVDSLLQQASWAQNVGFDARHLEISSKFDVLVVAGGRGASVRAYGLAPGVQNWQANVPFASDTVAFLDMSLSGNEVYLANYEGEIRGYNLSGQLIRNTSVVPARPESILAHNGQVLVERRQSNGVFSIDRYRTENGFLISQLQLPIDVKGITTRSATEYYLVGMQNGNPRLLIYDPTEPGYRDPQNLPVGEVFTAVQGQGDQLWIAHSNGIYLYRYNPVLLNLILPGVQTQKLVFDEVLGVFYTAVGNEMIVFSQTGQPLATFSFSGKVLDIAPHHTR